jgi:hypothetical protein
MLSDFSPHLVQDDLPVAALQFSVDEVPSVLLELDTSKAGRQVETFIRETNIQERQAQQRSGLSWSVYMSSISTSRFFV